MSLSLKTQRFYSFYNNGLSVYHLPQFGPTERTAGSPHSWQLSRIQFSKGPLPSELPSSTELCSSKPEDKGIMKALLWKKKTNHGPIRFPLLIAVASFMNDLHLLHNCAFARFTGTQQQQLDFPLRSVMVCFELNCRF